MTGDGLPLAAGAIDPSIALNGQVFTGSPRYPNLKTIHDFPTIRHEIDSYFVTGTKITSAFKTESKRQQFFVSQKSAEPNRSQ